jgi:hypothetical protein
MKIRAAVLRRVLPAVVTAVVLGTAACHKDSPHNLTNNEYTGAINAYWSAHPACLFPDTVKMPTQQDTDKTDRTAGYDALTDLGFLQRLQATKKTFIFGQKQVSDYDLTPTGRNAWVADPNQPGYGNFCFGHRTVSTVDNVATVANTTGSGPNPASATVSYHYTVPDAASWARNAEIQTAFPATATLLSAPQADTATLTNTTSGWQMAPPTAPGLGKPNGNPANDYGVVGSH